MEFDTVAETQFHAAEMISSIKISATWRSYILLKYLKISQNSVEQLLLS